MPRRERRRLLGPRGLERGPADEAVEVGRGLGRVGAREADLAAEEERVADVRVRDREPARAEEVAAVLERRVQQAQAREEPLGVVVRRAAEVLVRLLRGGRDRLENARGGRRRRAKSRYRSTSVCGKVSVASAW
jgi:hypothetical protein